MNREAELEKEIKDSIRVVHRLIHNDWTLSKDVKELKKKNPYVYYCALAEIKKAAIAVKELKQLTGYPC